MPAPSKLVRFRVLPLLLLCSVPLHAGEAELPPAEKESRWHIQVGASWWLNTKIRYGATPAADPSMSAKTDRLYDDGYNRVDVSGNVGDGTGGVLPSRTGYFGYVTSNQVNLTTGLLTLHQLQAEGIYPSERAPTTVGPHIAVRYDRDPKQESGMHLMWEVSLDMASIDRRYSGVFPATLRLLSDAYKLGGVVPQPAPYSGRFTPLPGDQRIGDIPARNITYVNGTVEGTRSLGVDLTVVRAGPVTELAERPSWPNQRWGAYVQAGVAFLHAAASLEVDETLRTTGMTGAPRTTMQFSESWNRLGWFAGLRARRLLSEKWSVSLRADLLMAGSHTVYGPTRNVTIDNSRDILLTLAFDYTW